ncbi:MAG: prepilin-type N-terminal cleavage/methylation domain-containing protein [Gammaproteobacteria bacterium]|jgi:type II secretion system protein H|nr:prepilin-type N-terminal cleavage/methylation domain-containing protein [Xanthomonadales bacterium]
MKRSHGFTLIEILIVVVIISILTVLGVQMTNSGSVERNLQQQGQILQSSIEYACDQAVLQNIPYGVKFSLYGYTFSRFYQQQWLDVETEYLFPHLFNQGFLLNLEIDGQNLVLDEDFSEFPQLLCDANGQLSEFVAKITDATELHGYQVKSDGLWQMQGGWIDES